MSKTVPTTFTSALTDTSRVRPGRDATVEEWYDLFEALHYLWSRSGARGRGFIFPSLWKTTVTASYQTATTGTGDYSLNACKSVLLPVRRCESSGTLTYALVFAFYGRYVDVQATVHRMNGGSTTALTAITASTSTGNSELVVATSNFETEATHHVSGSTANPMATLHVTYAAKSTTGGQTAELFYLLPYEQIAPNTLLPTA